MVWTRFKARVLEGTKAPWQPPQPTNQRAYRHRARESAGAPAKQKRHGDTRGKLGNKSSVEESQDTNWRSENEHALLCFRECVVL